eukprot:2201138-Alexandrium_andersonii.AAC.1
MKSLLKAAGLSSPCQCVDRGMAESPEAALILIQKIHPSCDKLQQCCADADWRGRNRRWQGALP